MVVLARVNSTILLFEDKTASIAYEDPLERYCSAT